MPCIEHGSVLASVNKLIQKRRRKVPIKACLGSYLLLGEALDHCTTAKRDKYCCYRSLVLLDVVCPVGHTMQHIHAYDTPHL